MPHVVHLETSQHLYGSGRQVLLLIEGLLEKGVECTLVCPPDSEIAAAAAPGVTVHTLPMAADLNAAFAYRFAKFLGAAKPDLVHVHSRRGADLWGGMGARWAGVPAVLSRRVDKPEQPMLAPMKYGRYERVIGISNGVIDALKVTGVKNEKLRLVRSAVDAAGCQPSWSRADFQQAFGLTDNHLAVACVAPFASYCGHRCLFDAWAEVVSACPDARLLLFGEGPEQAALRAQAKNSVYGASVHFAGFRADLREFMGHAALLVHPAEREGLGIALLEAQAAGVPVIASRAGGMPEAVADGVSGVLVEPGNAAELAKRMVRLLRDAELRQRLAASGPTHVAEYFSPASMVAGNLDVYKELWDAQPAAQSDVG